MTSGFLPSLLAGEVDGLPLDFSRLDSTMIKLGIRCFARNSMSVPCVLYMFSVRLDIYKLDGGLSHASFINFNIDGIKARLSGGSLSQLILSKIRSVYGEGGSSTCNYDDLAILEIICE